mmetsp:Transcript_22483/g.60816  ORF Transcript_22483/g.60816 Transcript_22483/m.60816 type:complete len:291 (+) Transcript_22483:213-1085(+)
MRNSSTAPACPAKTAHFVLLPLARKARRGLHTPVAGSLRLRWTSRTSRLAPLPCVAGRAVAIGAILLSARAPRLAAARPRWTRALPGGSNAPRALGAELALGIGARALALRRGRGRGLVVVHGVLAATVSADAGILVVVCSHPVRMACTPRYQLLCNLEDEHLKTLLGEDVLLLCLIEPVLELVEHGAHLLDPARARRAAGVELGRGQDEHAVRPAVGWSIVSPALRLKAAAHRGRRGLAGTTALVVDRLRDGRHTRVHDHRDGRVVPAPLRQALACTWSHSRRSRACAR